MNGTAVQNKISRALGRVKASAQSVYLRTVSASGGNNLLGIGVTRSKSDTLVDPTPAVRQVSSGEIATSGGLYQPGDYRFVFAGSIPRETLRNCQIVYGTQVLQVMRIDESVLDGVVVAWTVMARSVEAGE